MDFNTIAAKICLKESVDFSLPEEKRCERLKQLFCTHDWHPITMNDLNKNGNIESYAGALCTNCRIFVTERM